jgi:hypothetical protein
LVVVHIGVRTSFRDPLTSVDVSGEDRKSPALEWPDGAEVSFVEAEDACGFVSASDDHKRAVGEPKVEIGVARIEVMNGGVVLALQIRDREASGGEVGDEAAPWSASRAGSRPPP